MRLKCFTKVPKSHWPSCAQKKVLDTGSDSQLFVLAIDRESRDKVKVAFILTAKMHISLSALLERLVNFHT